jgi:hypothetical protein
MPPALAGHTRKWMRPGRLFLLALLSLLATALLGVIGWKAPPPGPLSEPSAIRHLFHPELAVVREGGATGDRVIELEKADKKFPTYWFGRRTTLETHDTRGFGFTATPMQTASKDGVTETETKVDIDWGFYHRRAKWTCAPLLWRMDVNPPGFAKEIDEATLAGWRPLLVAYLNKDRGGHAGDELAAALDKPVVRESMLCWQNAVILAAYLALASTIVLLFAALVAKMVAIVRMPTALEMGRDE